MQLTVVTFTQLTGICYVAPGLVACLELPSAACALREGLYAGGRLHLPASLTGAVSGD